MSERLDYNHVTPQGMRGLDLVHAYIKDCGLRAALIDLVYLRTSQINGCAYCVDLHVRDLRRQGVAVEKIVLVQTWREAGSLFDIRERAALAWAETVTRVELTGIPDADHFEAAAVFEPKELADLTIAISAMNAFNRLAIAFRRTPEAARDSSA